MVKVVAAIKKKNGPIATPLIRKLEQFAKLSDENTVGLADDDGFDLPVTQEDLRDTMGLSTVHVNRTFQELRGQGLITSKGRQISVDDVDRLFEFADFNPNYLHQVGRRA
jgi:CRP-like cAMP-binding protein